MGKFKIVSTLILIFSLNAHADVVLTMGGDVNFNRNRQAAHPDGVVYGTTVTPWKSFTSQLRPLINGDINFANIETVVSSTNDLQNEEKKFAFKSHPNAIRHLIGMGFNLFNISNNHTYDYGFIGMGQTVFEMETLKSEFPNMVYDGVGSRSQVLKPKVFDVNGIRFAFASLSIGEPRFRATTEKIGMLLIRDDRDYKELVEAFARTQADYKILSIHFGTEGKVTLEEGQKDRFEYAVKYGGVQLIIGHHPHVIRPVEKWADRLIYYSLGNYLMVGSADITKKADPNTDWGMFSRLYLEKDPATGTVKVDAIEVIPLTNTHGRTAPMTADKAGGRIDGLNKLSAMQLGNYAMRFDIDPMTGRGIFCDSEMTSIRAKAMCAGQLSLK
ncbi:CapA family protein [Bdellovibrio bacteriovorus]|uniref:CapA family protein n=1 Tax=Bdellovibrio bacteriovorus TaxID=959 RepID=UPI0035A8B446